MRIKVVKGSKRHRYVKLNPTLTSQLATAGSQFDLPLFDGEQAALRVYSATGSPGNTNSFVVRCSVVGKALNRLILVRENGAFAGTYATADGRQFQIGTASGDLHYLSEVDPAEMATCGVKGKTPPTPVYYKSPDSSAPAASGSKAGAQLFSASRTASITTAKPTLDLVVIYTADLMNYAGGVDAMNAKIKLALAEGQEALDNSEVNVRLRLVHTELTSYNETGNLDTDLTRLAAPKDGYMDDAIVARDKYRADVLSLWVDASTSSAQGTLTGLAYQLLPGSTIYTYNVIYGRLAIGTYIPVHEIGHNFGCDHEPEFSSSTPLYPYAHAYFFQSADGFEQHETVMTASAHSPQRNPPYFSNPNVFYDNGSGPVPTGTSSNNNALVINNTVAKLTAFRVAPGLGEALDAPTINWTSGGDVPWFWQPGTTHDGSDAAQSGAIVANQSSSLQGTVTGPARLSFWWNVASEQAGDFLSFSIDGVQQWSASGAGTWTQEKYFIPSGSHTIQWVYSKNGSVDTGADAAWFDQVQLTPLKLPTVTITAPAANARVFNPNLTVTGTARDDVQVDHVEYQLQNSSGESGWQIASGLTNWSATLTLVPGTNTITARAIGYGLQTSLHVSRSFFYVVTNMLTVGTNGLGKFTPSLDGKFLEIGRRYTITAMASNNWVFSNWSGSISSNAAILNFLMQPNMVLTGNFVTNPFIPVK
ncbi:MAG: peptidyl-Asp metalloendopeptidase, partial [Verrucomicrobiales bacterium]|nr:peptidyl-Asp metalloendopeptidase [Verrucomicrobiales bacterium]